MRLVDRFVAAHDDVARVIEPMVRRENPAERAGERLGLASPIPAPREGEHFDFAVEQSAELLRRLARNRYAFGPLDLRKIRVRKRMRAEGQPSCRESGAATSSDIRRPSGRQRANSAQK